VLVEEPLGVVDGMGHRRAHAVLEAGAPPLDEPFAELGAAGSDLDGRLHGAVGAK
jgi:hypothetical protein